MDIDKPLDELIPKRKTRSGGRGGSGGGGADRKPRQSREARDAAPYSRPPPRSTEDKWVHDAYTGPSAGRERGSRGAGAAPPAASVAFVGASPRIEISGIHYEVTADELKTIFSEAGTIVQGPTIRYDRSGRSTGVAVIEYASAQQAKQAINQFDGAMTKGQTIGIKLIAPPRPVGKKVAAEDAGSKSLLQRLGASDLSSRIGGSREPASREPASREAKEPRERRGDGGRGRGGRGGARGGRAPRAKRGPASATDLDKELDGFMAADVKMD